MTDDIPTVCDRPKIIYVMGAGRSGSTILGVALGNCTGVFYAGELDAWLRRHGVSHFHGEARAQFWENVRQEVTCDAQLFGDSAWRTIEHSAAALRFSEWGTRRRLRGRYRVLAQKLYCAIAQVSEASHIVDTSHYPLRARELQALDGIDFYLIYLVRRPERVMASFSRDDVDQPTLSPLVANLYLYLTHALAIMVFLRQPRERRFLLRYEDFASDPEGTVDTLLTWANTEPAAPDFTALSTGLAFQGNRLLRADTITFRSGSPTRLRDHRLTALAQLPWTLLLARLRPRLSVRFPRGDEVQPSDVA